MNYGAQLQNNELGCRRIFVEHFIHLLKIFKSRQGRPDNDDH